MYTSSNRLNIVLRSNRPSNYCITLLNITEYVIIILFVTDSYNTILSFDFVYYRQLLLITF